MVRKLAILSLLGIGGSLAFVGCGSGPEEPDRGNSGLTGDYVGSERCLQCHSRIHADWADTLHGSALETLEDIGQGTNASCLPCHTVGFGEEGGYVNRATTDALAGVGCETCHGPSRQHVENVSDVALRPPTDISSTVCGACHTGSHHPTFEEWSESGHSAVTPTLAGRFNEGTSLNACGSCHSGDFIYEALFLGESVPDDALAGVDPMDMHAVECAICHNPHARTGNAVEPEDGRDYQLRFPEVTSPIPTNTVEAVTNVDRFNLCGKCHHARGRTWVDSSRGPHHSVQVNVYIGEMAMPEDTDPLVPSRTSVHTFAREQCANCHMYREDFQDENAPAISGHTFAVNNGGCAASGCHPSVDQAIAAQATLQMEVQSRLDAISEALGDPADWEYTSNGGPDSEGQAEVSDRVKQVRFMYYYMLEDSSLGVHNPAYVRSMLDQSELLLVLEGLLEALPGDGGGEGGS